MGPLTADDWRSLITALVLLANALTGYLVYLSHRHNGSK